MATLDPLAKYLFRRVMESKTYEELGKYESAMHELGYWLMSRPAGMTEEQMKKVTQCRIYDECDWVAEAERNFIPIDGYPLNAEREVVAVYKERENVDPT